MKVPDATTRELRLEIIAAGSRQPVLAEIWKLPPVVAAGDPLLLEYRLRGSGALECRAFLADDPDEPFECRAENPLVNVVSPSPVRLRIEALEEELRGRGQARPEDRDRWVELAECYAKLEQKEKAIDLLRSVLRVINRPDHLILNLQGLYYADLGDYRRAEKAYREAAQHSGNWAGPWFNLALSYIRQNRYADALSAVEAGLQREPNEAPYLTLRAQCLDSLGREGEAKSQYVTALNANGGPTSMSDWELGWYLTCAEAVGNTKAAEKAKAERRRRARPDRTIDVSHAPRPERQ